MLDKLLYAFVAMAMFYIGTTMDKPVDKSRYIDKSQCIGLPSSNVNDYWACKKEVK